MQTLSQLSGGTRKFLALAILFFVALLTWTIILSPVVSAVQTNLNALEDARFQRMRLENLQARAEPDRALALTADTVISAKSKEEAAAQFAAFMTNLAVSSGLQISSISPREGNRSGSLIGAELSFSGEEVKIASFINLAEQGSPTIRFQSWTIDAGETGDPNINFSGLALAAWTKP